MEYSDGMPRPLDAKDSGRMRTTTNAGHAVDGWSITTSWLRGGSTAKREPAYRYINVSLGQSKLIFGLTDSSTDFCAI